jgi:hypothetical protein
MRRWKRPKGGNIACVVDLRDGRLRQAKIINETVAGARLVFPAVETLPSVVTVSFKERNQLIERTCQVMWTNGVEVGVKFIA